MEPQVQLPVLLHHRLASAFGEWGLQHIPPLSLMLLKRLEVQVTQFRNHACRGKPVLPAASRSPFGEDPTFYSRPASLPTCEGHMLTCQEWELLGAPSV